GKIETVKYAIQNNIPIFGICLGLHAMSIAIAQLNGHPDANSTEFDEDCPCPVIDMMEEQKKIKNMGGTMRLGAYPCKIKEGTIAYEAYKEEQVSERHRHRYEVNNEYRDVLTDYGAVISGTSPDDFLVEMIELENHPWFLGCQFHPEFKSRPNSPHPIFKSFIKAAKDNKKNNI
ncbi:MAG: gamma-glutamyl-gamma-aminobutyrate hydrolase family protein, partial [Methanosphaera sp.]|nr:gamma-glutamyl-gamma-aminobutyrate hydrolase family protein [Methanosphaera sp.]